MHVNCHYSSWLNVHRRVRQGVPLSLYLYLICGEILLTMTRESSSDQSKHKKTILLSQFADDTTFCLDGSEESFNENLQAPVKFALYFGLRIINNKTRVARIGNKKNSEL